MNEHRVSSDVSQVIQLPQLCRPIGEDPRANVGGLDAFSSTLGLIRDFFFRFFDSSGAPKRNWTDILKLGKNVLRYEQLNP